MYTRRSFGPNGQFCQRTRFRYHLNFTTQGDLQIPLSKTTLGDTSQKFLGNTDFWRRTEKKKLTAHFEGES